MENRAKLLGFLIGVLATAGPFSYARQATASQPAGEVPFEIRHSCLVIARGSLNGVKGRTLLIDTGSNPTVLDVKMARTLGVSGGATDLLTLQGHLPANNAVLSSVTVGPVTAKSVPVFIADLSYALRDIGIRVDAIVGLDVLKGSDFVIDYRSQRIIFGPAPRYRDSIAFETGPPLIRVTIEIDGEPKRLLVDTGAEGLFIFRTQNPTEDMAAEVKPGNSSHVSLERNRVQVEIPELRLGTLELKRQPAYVEDSPQLSAYDFDGLLGPLALGMFQVVFDFHNRKLGWNLDSDEVAPLFPRSPRADGSHRMLVR